MTAQTHQWAAAFKCIRDGGALIRKERGSHAQTTDSRQMLRLSTRISDMMNMKQRVSHRPGGQSRRGLTFLLVLCSLVAATRGGFAQSSDRLPPGFRFLTIGGGARAVGLAETMVADGSDPFVIEYNPAGLAALDRSALSFSHNSFFQDSRGEYISVAGPVGRWACGARIGYMGVDNIPRREGPTEQPLAYYDASNGVFQAAGARTLNEHLSAGVSAAYVLEHIDVRTAQSFVFGLGLQYRQSDRLMFGAAFANLGPQTHFVDRSFRMPDLFRIGATWQHRLGTLRAELVAPDNESARWNFGVEATPDPRLALRAGLKVGYSTQTFAAGFGAHTLNGRIGIDYAFAPYTNDLGSTHRFGLTLRP